MNAELREAVERADKARNFPHNTCASSRHVQLMAEALASGKQYPMLAEEPAYCAESMLATVAALYEARTALRDQEAEVARLRTMTACTMGVGRGGGSLFVHGDFDSIKAAQSLVFRAEKAEALLRACLALLHPDQPEHARITAHLGGENNG